MTDAALVPAGNNSFDRYAAVIADPQTMEVVGQRVMDGETLKKIAHSWQIPVMRFVEWVVNDAVRCGLYQAALKVRADAMVHETLEIADEGSGDSRRDSLRVRTRLQVASHFDPQRFGPRLEKNVNVRVGRLASELSDDELMALIDRSTRDSRVLEGTSTEVVAEAKRITDEPIDAGTGLI